MKMYNIYNEFLDDYEEEGVDLDEARELADFMLDERAAELGEEGRHMEADLLPSICWNSTESEVRKAMAECGFRLERVNKKGGKDEL